MKKQTIWKKEKSRFKSSFRLDSKILKLVLIDIILLAILIMGLKFWGSSIESLSPLLDEVANAKDSFGQINLLSLQGHEDTMQKVYASMIGYSILYLIAALLITSLFKLQYYRVLNNKQPSLKKYWSFLLLAVCWLIISVIFIYIIQAILYLILGKAIMGSFLAQISFLVLSFISLFILFYTTVRMFNSYIQSKSLRPALRLFFNHLRQFKYSLIRIAFIILIFLAVNIVMLVFGLLPKTIHLIITTLLLVTFFSWARLYITSCTLKNK